MFEFREGIVQALREELARDPEVFLLGEDIAAAGGVFKLTEHLFEEFGPERVIDTPISELAMTSAAYGAALMGKRPILEIMFGDFMPLAMDSIVNQSAKYWYLSNEERSIPVTIRTAVGAGGRFGAIHSQNPGIWFQGVPGLKIVCPATPGDAKALLKGAIRDQNPVIVLEHKRLFNLKGEESPEEVIEPGHAAVVRPGSDVTIVSVMKGVHDCLAAAEMLESEGVSAEIIDLRSLRPLDLPTVIASVEKTSRLLCVEEGPRTGGWAAGLTGQIAADALDLFEDMSILNTPPHPIPFAPALEDRFLPSAETIRDEVLSRQEVAV